MPSAAAGPFVPEEPRAATGGDVTSSALGPDPRAAATVAATRSVVPSAGRSKARPEVIAAAKALMAAGVPLELATAQAELKCVQSASAKRRRAERKSKKEKAKKEKKRRREKDRR